MAIISYQLSEDNLTSFITEFNTYYADKMIASIDTTDGAIIKISDTNSNPLIDINFGGETNVVGIYLYRNGSMVHSEAKQHSIHRYPSILMASKGFIIHQLSGVLNSSSRYWHSGFCAINDDGSFVTAASTHGASTTTANSINKFATVESLNPLNTTETISFSSNETVTPTILCNVWTESGIASPSISDNCFLYVCSPYVSNVGIVTLKNVNYVTNGYWCIKDQEMTK